MIYILIGILAIAAIPTLVWIWMLLDCVRNEPVGSPERLKWTLFMLVFGPFAAIAYQSGRRKQRIRLYGK